MASRADSPSGHDSRVRRTAWTLWLAVATAFLLLGFGWVVLFRVAHSAHIETVPLATKGGRP